MRFAPETEKRLADLAAKTGCGTVDELVQDVIQGYFEGISEVGETLDRRFDDMESGKVKGIPAEEVEAYFREKSAAARRSLQVA